MPNIKRTGNCARRGSRLFLSLHHHRQAPHRHRETLSADLIDLLNPQVLVHNLEVKVAFKIIAALFSIAAFDIQTQVLRFGSVEQGGSFLRLLVHHVEFQVKIVILIAGWLEIEVEVEGLGKLTNRIVQGPTPIRDDVGAQPTESEEVISTAMGGDWEHRGKRAAKGEGAKHYESKLDD